MYFTLKTDKHWLLGSSNNIDILRLNKTEVLWIKSLKLISKIKFYTHTCTHSHGWLASAYKYNILEIIWSSVLYGNYFTLMVAHEMKGSKRALGLHKLWWSVAANLMYVNGSCNLNKHSFTTLWVCLWLLFLKKKASTKDIGHSIS